MNSLVTSCKEALGEDAPKCAMAVLGSTWQHLAALGSTWQYLSILSKHQDQTGSTVMGIAGTNFQKNAEPTSCSPLKWFNG